MARQQLKRYIWLIDTIRSSNGITFEEINDRWMHSSLNDEGKPIPLRTFHDHRSAIQEEFDIEIQCDRRDNTYRIADEFNEYGSIKSNLIDALVLDNAIREKPSLNDSIVFNDNFHQESLPMLVRSIKEHRTIQFKYKRDYTSIREMQARMGVPMEEWAPDIVKYLEFEPYGLYFSTLWFVVGRIASNDTIHIYALHRILGINFLDKHYIVPADFDVRQFMSNYQLSDEDYEPDISLGREYDDRFALAHFESQMIDDTKY